MDADMNPDEVSSILSIQPTSVQRKGERNADRKGKIYSLSGWFLSTEGILESRDARRHLDWIIEKVKEKKVGFQEFHTRGYLVDMCIRWNSKSGHGGPTLSPKQMSILADLEVELWFDIYVGTLEE